MAVTDRYRTIADLPAEIAVFPLAGCILLPRAMLPLNVFEPRYLRMVDDVLSGSRLLGIIQPAAGSDDRESPAGKGVPLRRVGCLGRLTSYEEMPDGRLRVALTGVARFALGEEVESTAPYRRVRAEYGRFSGDLGPGGTDDGIDRPALIEALRAFLDARRMQADWASIERSGSELLINGMAMASPFGPEEKQALIEAPTLADRASALIALARMALAGDHGAPAGEGRRRLQ